VSRLRELRREARAEAAAPGAQAQAGQAGDRPVSSRAPEN
jgi:hypothetical protein